MDLEPHRKPLLNFAMKLCGNRDRAEDLVQETFLRALIHQSSFVPGTNLSAWLFTILKNRFRSDWRRHQREVEDVDDQHAMRLSVSPSQHIRLEAMEEAMKLDRLNADHREVYQLVVLEGLTYDEAAEETGIEIGTVKSRVHRAKQQLHRGENSSVRILARNGMSALSIAKKLNMSVMDVMRELA